MSVKNEVLWRVYAVTAVVLIVAVAILTRLFTLTVTDSKKWINKADSLYVKLVEVPAQRGNILADDGSLLATSLPFFDIHFDAKAEGLTPEIFNDQALDSLSWLLSTYIDQQYTPGAYRQWFDTLRAAPANTRGIRYVPIAKGLPYSKYLLIKSFPIFREGRYAGGFIAEQVSKRERPFKLLAQRTIGYAQREDALPVGLEGSFNTVLNGKTDKELKQLMMRVPGDIYIPVGDLAEIEPAQGSDIVTTLDINIQDATETALLDACISHNADHGCAIVMEVKTGKIKAIANIGRTETNGKIGYWETYNYAVGERVEPGSMFKLASFMAMMEAGGLKDFDEKIPVYKGKVKIYNEELVDAVPHGMDSMTVRQIFAYSSNVGTATLALVHFKNKPAAFVSQLRQFNLDMPTGIEVPGEENPIIKGPNEPNSGWSGTSLPWMSIGYEMLLSPLQLLTFFNAVANNGRLMKPYLVQRIERYGEVVKEFQPYTVKRSIASKTTLQKAKELLIDVVENGTASNIKTPLYQIAGKTGTAQLKYHKFRTPKGIGHQAGFCGFFPADNPVYSCIVVISKPERGGYHGAEVAAPVFRKIADKCFAMKAELHKPINATPRPQLPLSQLPTHDAGKKEDLKKSMRWLGLEYEADDDVSEWGVVAAKDSIGIALQNRPVSNNTVPSVVGMGLKDAIYLLENRGCKVRAQGVGKVKMQSLLPGTKANGQVCVLHLQ